MKKLIPYFVILSLLFSGCSAKKDLMNGNYDAAIRKTVRKLKKKPEKIKNLDILEQAFNNANRRDTERITFLKKEGTPDIWEEIFRAYSKMKKRQNIVKPLSFVPTNISFVDYDEEIIRAKQKAAEYFYAHGKKLLATNDRQDARKAFYDFQKVKSYYSDFSDVDKQIKLAKHLGTSHVLFKMQNKTGILLPPAFEEDLMKISVTDLNRQWLRYYNNNEQDLQFDYTVLLNLKIIDVSPEQVKEKHYTEKKEVRDGWSYVLDEKGNVKKDTAGNDIKVPKYKTISCAVVESHQRKAAVVSGTLDYINNGSGQLIKTDPVTSEAIFEHLSALAIGDINALKPETRKLIGRTPVPFPPDGDLIMQASAHLKKMVKDIMHANKRLLK